MQQATVNLFADMGVQPGTPHSGLTAATSSPGHHSADLDDHLPDEQRLAQDGNQVTISGAASDAGGGVVAGVEISTDGGSDLASGDDQRPGRADCHLEVLVGGKRLSVDANQDPRHRRQRQHRNAI